MQTITAAQLKRMIDGDEQFELINVLSESDFQQEHVPGSINIPVEDRNFIKRIEDRVEGDKGRKIVVYCASAECNASPTAAKNLDQAGFTNVLDFEAGMQGWKQAGHPIESGKVRA